ncbi:MAG: YabP/YqfC family sporulation protein [Clostridia bacterium]|nr:YabP/YqfC family sporulation protein [Clostridia bacterium]
MAFLDEITDKLGLSAGDSVGGCKVTIYGRTGVVVEGHKGLYYYGEECVRVRVKGGMLSIEGAQLHIKSTNNQELIVTGKIDCVKTEDYAR